MIIYAHGQRNQYDSTPIRTILCALVFADITTFFFISFMNICFDTIVSHPPPVLLLVLFIIMGLDIVAGFYLLRGQKFVLVLNAVIMIFLILSWSIDNQYTLFLSGLVLLRFPEIVKFNDILQDKLRSRKYLFKCYVLVKIIYMFVVVGHILGCIFYSIDHAMIKQEYYGKIQENPQHYYQGKLLCYSPIYSLDEINRYLYSMYYIFSLMATVAYGDIIPKNAHQNAYVCFLLVFATVAAGFIIEQMLIVFNDYWYVAVFELRKVRYMNAVLKQNSSISQSNRFKLANFLFYILSYSVNQPQMKRLSNSLQIRLMYQTVQSKKDSSSIKDQPVSNINIKLCEMQGLPIFLLQFLLVHLEFRLFPDHYFIVDNSNLNQSAAFFINLRGRLKIGYGDAFMMKRSVDMPRKLLCWRQFLFNNKQINKYLRIETKSLCELLTMKSSKLHQFLHSERQQSRNNEFVSKMLQSYYMAMQSELLQIQQENRYCPYSNSNNQVSISELIDKQSNESHYLICWGCGNSNHMPVQCPVWHFKVSPDRALRSQRMLHENQKYNRRRLISKKITKGWMGLCLSKQAEQARDQMHKYVVRKKQQVEYFKNLVMGSQQKIIQKYEKYSEFHIQYNFQ